MISHTTLGTNDLEKADGFYRNILTEIGGTQIHKSEKVMFWQFDETGTKLSISLPFDGEPASHGNGSMVALKLNSIDKVQEVYSMAMAMAMALGGTCEGKPGERYNGAFYGAYFRDLDGNKIAIFYR